MFIHINGIDLISKSSFQQYALVIFKGWSLILIYVKRGSSIDLDCALSRMWGVWLGFVWMRGVASSEGLGFSSCYHVPWCSCPSRTWLRGAGLFLSHLSDFGGGDPTHCTHIRASGEQGCWHIFPWRALGKNKSYVLRRRALSSTSYMRLKFGRTS